MAFFTGAPASALAQIAAAQHHRHQPLRSPWSRPELLGTSKVPAGVAFGVSGLDMGMAADGSSLTTWTHHGIHVRQRSANGHLGPDQLVTPNAAGDGTLAVAPNGTAIIVWAVKQGDTFENFARVRSADGQLGPVRDLGGQMEQFLDILYGPRDGLARLIWAQDPFPPSAADPPGRFLAALGDTGDLSSPAALDVSSQDTVSTALVNTFSAVAVNGDGDALIVWLDQAQQKLFGRVLSHNGSLGPRLTIANSAGATPEPDVALSGSGSGYVVWGSGFGLSVRQVNLDGTMGPALRVGSDSGTAADVASLSDGRAVVAWTQGYFDSILGRVVSRTHIGARFRISPAQGQNPRLLASGRQAVAVWTDVKAVRDQARGLSYLYSLASRTISTSGALGAPVTLFPRTGRGSVLAAWSVAVAGNARGQVAASWLARNQAGSRRKGAGVRVLVAERK